MPECLSSTHSLHHDAHVLQLHIYTKLRFRRTHFMQQATSDAGWLETAAKKVAVCLQAEARGLPRMSAAYGFMADPAGLSSQPSTPYGPTPVVPHPRRGTLAPVLPPSPPPARVSSLVTCDGACLVPQHTFHPM